MCSIAAIYRINPQQTVQFLSNELDIIQAMSDKLTHRGPDDRGIWQDEYVSLAHNRLAVMDPAGGHQPMTSVYQGRHYSIIYNGELYNTDE
jgi:asparagine synthase (glutamine-hydrolysing)